MYLLDTNVVSALRLPELSRMSYYFLVDIRQYIIQIMAIRTASVNNQARSDMP